MQKILAAASLLFLSSLPARAEVFLDKTFTQATTEAGQSHRLVMIDFYTTWCVPCKRLDRVTWKDPTVDAWLAKHVLCLRVDAEKDVALAKRYHIVAYPTMVFVKPDGTESGRLVGFMEPKQFVTEAEKAVLGVDPVVDLQDRLKRASTADERFKLHQELGDTYANRGRHKEALESYLWCFDVGKDASAYGGVRRSFLLNAIAHEGADYPMALTALTARRDACESRLKDGADDADTVLDYTSLNEALKQSARSLELFDHGTPKLRKAMLARVIDPLIEARRYSEIVDIGGDLKSLVERSFGFRGFYLEIYGPKAEHPDPESLANGDEHFVEQVARFYEVELGAGQTANAEAIAQRLLAAGPTGVYPALIAHAARAGHPEVARKLGAEGLNAVPAEQRPAIQKALEKLSP